MLKKILILLTASVFASLNGAQAQNEGDGGKNIKIIQVKGNRAIIVFSKKGPPLEKGQLGYLVERGNMSDKADKSDLEAPSKDKFVGLEAGFSLLSTKAGAGDAVKSDQFDMSVLYGWNKVKFEFGPFVGYSFNKGATIDTRTIELGALADFNFKANNSENSMVFGARMVFAMGQQDHSAQAKAASTMRIEPGVVMKWFGLDANLATVATLGYRMQTVSLEAAEAKTSGIVGRLGIQTYF